MTNCCNIDTPLGEMLATAAGEQITGLYFCGQQYFPAGDFNATKPSGVLIVLRDQLQEYFDGRRRQFDLPLAPQGTPFQQSVWQQLLKIPYGETRSYGDLANALNNLGAIRAVGAANGRNPISIVIPCHRVIGSDGTLTGYAGGIERKQKLLAREDALNRDFDQLNIFSVNAVD